MQDIPTQRLSEYIDATRKTINVLSRRINSFECWGYEPSTFDGLEQTKSERELQQLLLVTLLTEYQRRQQSGKEDAEGKPA